MKYQKTYWANVISAVFWVVLLISLVANGFYGATTDNRMVLIALIVIHIFLIGVFSLTAYIIKAEKRNRLGLVSEALNYSLILLVSGQFIFMLKYYMNPSYIVKADGIVFFGIVVLIEILFFVLLAVINLKALNVTNKN